MTPRGWAIVAGAVLLAATGGYGAGRYAVPAKVEVRTQTKIETHTEYVNRDVVKVVQGPTHTVTLTKTISVAVPCPATGVVPGTETVITTTTDTGPTVTDSASSSSAVASTNTVATSATVTTQEQPRWMLQAGAATGTDLRLVYNVGGSRRITGPLWVGAAYHTDKRLELRVGMTF